MAHNMMHDTAGGRVKTTHGTVTAITVAGEHDSDVDGVTQMANAMVSRRQ